MPSTAVRDLGGKSTTMPQLNLSMRLQTHVVDIDERQFRDRDRLFLSLVCVLYAAMVTIVMADAASVYPYQHSFFRIFGAFMAMGYVAVSLPVYLWVLRPRLARWRTHWSLGWDVLALLLLAEVGMVLIMALSAVLP